MPPYVCHAVVLLFWGFCILQGTTLKCHICQSDESQSDCLQTSDEMCQPGQDVCTIQTTWRGDLYNDMNLVKSCGVSSECPGSSHTTSSCQPYEAGWSCTLCCKDNLCNSGANGNVPRPPPYPPIPDPLVRRLTSGCGTTKDNCQTTLTWSDESRRIQINKQCASQNNILVGNIFQYTAQCNIPAVDPGYCVTCCLDNSCMLETTDAAVRPIVFTSLHQSLLLLTTVLTRLLC
ncbi:uncharacterized protein [Asterias amurensis]|uniref:uncharacterized protein n=1 Tax=Asterias amurensis TaxID=7602 RepID=UPI003AB2FC13